MNNKILLPFIFLIFSTFSLGANATATDIFTAYNISELNQDIPEYPNDLDNALRDYKSNELSDNEKIQLQTSHLYSILSYVRFSEIWDDSGFISMNDVISDRPFKIDNVYKSGFFDYNYDKAFYNYAAYLKIYRQYFPDLFAKEEKNLEISLDNVDKTQIPDNSGSALQKMLSIEKTQIFNEVKKGTSDKKIIEIIKNNKKNINLAYEKYILSINQHFSDYSQSIQKQIDNAKDSEEQRRIIQAHGKRDYRYYK